MKLLVPLALVVICLPVVASAQCDVTFGSAARYGVPEEPFWLRTADFDGDGRADIAAMGIESRSISFLLQRDIGFVHADAIPLMHAADVLLSAGGSDLVAVGGAGISFISALKATTSTITGEPLTSVAASGDVNGDGIRDVAAVSTARSLRIFLGKADGTFAEQGAPITLPGSALDLEMADVTGDGKSDLLVADSRTGLIFEGNGDATFKASRQLHPGLTNVRRITIGDYDNDGRDDVMAATSLLLASDPGTRRTVAFNGQAVDLDRDGKLDNFSTTEIHRGNGDGTFTVAAVMPDEGPGSRSAVFADFDRDSILDVAVGTAWQDVAIYYGRGSMEFDGAPRARGSSSPYTGLTSQDFNGDGRADVAASSLAETVVFVANERGRFTHKGRLPGAQAVAAGDFDGDGKVDLYVHGTGVARGIGDGTFGSLGGGGTSSDTTVVVTTAHLNDDRHLDVVFGSAFGSGEGGQLFFLTNDGAGTFNRVEVPVTGAVRAITAGDFNGDGLDDIVVSASRSYHAATLYLFDARSPQAPIEVASNVQPETVKAGDVNGDGLADLVTVSAPVDDVVILAGNGNGTFRAPRRINIPDGLSGAGVTLADFNGDDRTDITVSTYSMWDVLVFIQQNDGSFIEAAHIPASWWGEAVADFDGDGHLDVIVDDRLGWFRVALNHCGEDLPLETPFVRLVSNATSREGTPASFVAELDAAATGSVVFYEWTTASQTTSQPTSIGSAVVNNGRAVLTTTSLSRGTHEIYAVYLGDGPFMRSRSGLLEHVVSADDGKRRRSIRH